MDLMNKIKQLLFQPDKFFSSLKEKTIQDALLYYIILSAFSAVMSYLIFLAFGNFFIKILLNAFSLDIPLPEFTAIKMLGQMILGYVLGIVGSFVGAAILFVWILIFRGNKGYINAYQLYAYSQTPSLLFEWIPFIGFFAWIYSFVLLIIGTKKIYNFSATKAVLMYLIPVIILIILALIILAFAITALKFSNAFV